MSDERSYSEQMRERARSVARPAVGSRWRNRHTGEIATVTKVMDRSPGGGCDYPLVERVVGDDRRPWFADHDPWDALGEWHDHWEPA